MQISLRFQIFAISCFLIASFSMVYLSDTMTIWDGAESSFLYGLTSQEKPSFLPFLINQLFGNNTGGLATMPRLLGVSLLTLSLGFFYFSSHLLIGKKAALMTILVSISSFTLPLLSKIATADIWLFSFQLMAFISMVRFIKKPAILFRSLFYLFVAAGILIEPLSSMIIFLIVPTFIFVMGKERKALLQLNPWLATIFLSVIFHYSGHLYWKNDTFLLNAFQSGYGKFILVTTIGILPFFGYLLGAFRDVSYKLKRKEEFSILFFPVVIAALIGQSPLLVFGLAILIAKQMILFLDKNYPFGNWIKVGAVLNLTFSFFIAVFLMFKGLQEFGGIGFRVGLGFSLAYWSLGVAGIIGLFSKDKRILWGGTLLNGLMSFLILVSAVYPLIESKRDIPRRLFNEIGQNAYIEHQILAESAPIHRKKMTLLAKQSFPNMEIDSTRSFEKIFQESPPKTLIIFKQNQIDSSLFLKYPNMINMKGWNDLFEEVNWSAVTR